jgi:flagella basal body P-ring formation protein FlgA
MKASFFQALACAALLCARPAPADPAQSAPKEALGGAQLAAELARSLAAHFHLDGDLQLELVRPWNPPAATAASWEVAIEDFPSIASSTMVLHCRISADGAPAQHVPVLVRACLWRDTWFARQPVAARTVFSPDLLEARRIDALQEHDGLPASAGSAEYIIARDVPADRMLTWHDLARRPLIHKGDVVDVTASEGLLSISMKALALQNGTRGDLVTVRNLESHKDVTALVVDEGHVEVRF